MKIKTIYTILILFVLACNPTANNKTEGGDHADSPQQTDQIEDRPKVSFTFDDGITSDLVDYTFKDWNQMILSAMQKEGITAVFFVTGRNKLDEKGKYLLESWSNEGHSIANHTYSHPYFNDEKISIQDFENELLKTDAIIANYRNYVKLFRFPYLKEGNTEEKIAGFRNVLSQNAYKNGYVTIDASDWYVNSELIKYIRKNGMDTNKIEQYKAFYLQHIMERANYYEKLSFELTNRHIKHTLLLHHNLTSALFLADLIQKFKEEGWEIINADEAFQDEIFNETPNINPAGESIIWALAKETGNYEDILRYPAEDSRYEIPKMERFGL